MTTAAPDPTHRRRPAAAGVLMGAAGLAAACLLAGCAAVPGSPAAAATPPAPAASSSTAAAEPEMVMVTLSDRGYRPSDIGVGVGQTVMLMVMNPGTRAHELRASIPLRGLRTDNPATPAASEGGAPAGATGFDITVPAGQELDLTFTPTAAGRYAMRDGTASVSTLVAV